MSNWAEQLHKATAGVARRIRRWWLTQRGAEIGPACWIQDIMVPRNAWDIRLGANVMLDRKVVFIATGDRTSTPRIQLRNSVYVNRFTVIDASESVTIGGGTMIGPHCYITDHDHGMEKGTPVRKQPLQGSPVVIGEDVWIGAGVTILKGVDIGNGAVVAAGAVVTQNVDEDIICGGVPARPIQSRSDVKS